MSDVNERPASGRLKKARGLFAAREAKLLLAIAVLSIITYINNNHFFSLYNIQGLLRQISIFSLLGIGASLVIITAGIDLSAGSMLAFNGVVTAMMMAGGLPWWLSIICSAGVAILIGCYHGVLVSRLNLPPFIVTLGSLSIFRGISVLMTKGYPIRIEEEAFLQIGQGLVGGIPVPFLILVGVALCINYMLRHTALGKHIYAVGGNIDAARLSGVSVGKTLVFVYGAATTIFFITSFIMAGRLGQGMPGIGIGYELNAIAAAVIGGTSLYGGIGTVGGTIIGAALLALIDNLLVMFRVEPWWNEVVMGAVIVIAIVMDATTNKE